MAKRTELERPPTAGESADHLAAMVEDLREELIYRYNASLDEITEELQAVVTGLRAAEGA